MKKLFVVGLILVVLLIKGNVCEELEFLNLGDNTIKKFISNETNLYF
jgi:hypothetical protein